MHKASDKPERCLGREAVQLVTDPDPESIERETLDAGILRSLHRTRCRLRLGAPSDTGPILAAGVKIWR